MNKDSFKVMLELLTTYLTLILIKAAVCGNKSVHGTNQGIDTKFIRFLQINL